MSKTSTTHAIFDFGGTLIDTMQVIIEILTNFANTYNQDLAPEVKAYIPEVNSVTEMCELLFKSLNLENEHASFKQNATKEIVNKFLSTKQQLVPGVDRLVKHLYRNNIPMAIATNSTKHIINGMSDNIRNYIKKYFSHTVCGADDPEVNTNKPNLEVYLICAKRFKTKPKSPDNCVIFEDSMIGITGAVASGMKSVLINDRSVESFESIADKITIIVNTFNDFKPESVGLPAYD